MRLLKSILISALSLSPLPVFAAEPPATAPAASGPPAPVAATVSPTPSAASSLDSVQKAATPSEAVAAYARAAASQPDNVQLEQAYVRSMVDFGMPELADAQAHDLINRNSADGLSIGVAAYMYAAKGDYGAGVQQLKVALMQSPDEPFLLRTAGQMVAWYDAQADRSKLTPTDVSSLEWIRGSENGKPLYVDAYKTWNQPPTPGDAQGNPASQPIQPTGDAQIVYPPQQPASAYTMQPQTTYVTNYYDNGYANDGYLGGYWAYPVYTNPFWFSGGRPWHHHDHGFDSFRPGFVGGPFFGTDVFIGSGRDRDFSNRFHDDRSRDGGFRDGFRDGRDGGRDHGFVPIRGGLGQFGLERFWRARWRHRSSAADVSWINACSHPRAQSVPGAHGHIRPSA